MQRIRQKDRAKICRCPWPSTSAQLRATLPHHAQPNRTQSHTSSSECRWSKAWELGVHRLNCCTLVSRTMSPLHIITTNITSKMRLSCESVAVSVSARPRKPAFRRTPTYNTTTTHSPHQDAKTSASARKINRMGQLRDTRIENPLTLQHTHAWTRKTRSSQNPPVR